MMCVCVPDEIHCMVIFKTLCVSLAREVIGITESRTKLTVLVSVVKQFQGSGFRVSVQGQVLKAQGPEIRAHCFKVHG